MSWTYAFPVMSDKMTKDFEAFATLAEEAELEESYGVKDVFNAQGNPHLVSFLLFR